MLKQAVLDGLVWFIFGLVCLVSFSSPLQLSWEETQLTQNLGNWKFACQFNSKNFGDQMFWDQIMFSSPTLIRSSSRLTVSAWVSPSSTPACNWLFNCFSFSNDNNIQNVYQFIYQNLSLAQLSSSLFIFSCTFLLLLRFSFKGFNQYSYPLDFMFNWIDAKISNF